MKQILYLSILIGMLIQVPLAKATPGTREIIEKLAEGSGRWKFKANANDLINYPYESEVFVMQGIERPGNVYFFFKTVTNFVTSTYPGGEYKKYEAEYREHTGFFPVADNEVVIQEYALGEPAGKLFRCQFNITNVKMEFECNRIYSSDSPWIIGRYYEEFRRESLHSQFMLSQP